MMMLILGCDAIPKGVVGKGPSFLLKLMNDYSSAAESSGKRKRGSDGLTLTEYLMERMIELKLFLIL